MVWKTNFKGDDTSSSVPKPSKREHIHKVTDSNVLKVDPPHGLLSDCSCTLLLQYYQILSFRRFTLTMINDSIINLII